jgi:sulfur-oxidizing protein SoxX
VRFAAIRIAPILLALASAPAGALEAYEVVGDAIPAPLGGKIGDPRRGRALVLDRTQGNCLICHQAP